MRFRFALSTVEPGGRGSFLYPRELQRLSPLRHEAIRQSFVAEIESMEISARVLRRQASARGPRPRRANAKGIGARRTVGRSASMQGPAKEARISPLGGGAGHMGTRAARRCVSTRDRKYCSCPTRLRAIVSRQSASSAGRLPPRGALRSRTHDVPPFQPSGAVHGRQPAAR